MGAQGRRSRAEPKPLAALDVLTDGPSLRLQADDPLATRRIRVPRVFADETGDGPVRICWDASAVQERQGIDDCLWEFVKLVGQPDRDIISFAKRWGPLGICAHGMPYTHAFECIPLSHEDRLWETPDERAHWAAVDPGFSADDPQTWNRFWEPLTAWRFYTRHFDALLAIAQALNEGHQVSPRTWFAAARWHVATEYEPLIQGEAYPPYPRHTAWNENLVWEWMARSSRGELQETFAVYLSTLLREARALPLMTWAPNEPRARLTLSFGQAPLTDPYSDELRLEIDSLFAVLTAQLVAAVQNPQGLYKCDFCHEVFARTERAPRHRRDGQPERILCSKQKCKQAAQREDKKKWAAQNRAEKRATQVRPTPISTPKPVNNGG
jgi:hypothetical protein